MVPYNAVLDDHCQIVDYTEGRMSLVLLPMVFQP